MQRDNWRRVLKLRVLAQSIAAIVSATAAIHQLLYHKPLPLTAFLLYCKRKDSLIGAVFSILQKGGDILDARNLAQGSETQSFCADHLGDC